MIRTNLTSDITLGVESILGIKYYGAGFLRVLSFFFAPALMLKQSGEGGKAEEGFELRFLAGPFSDHPPAG